MTEEDFVLQWVSRLSDVIVGSRDREKTWKFIFNQAVEAYRIIKKAYEPTEKQEE